MKHRMRLASAIAALAATLAPEPAGAQSPCRTGRAVHVSIDLQPPDAPVHERLERQLGAELAAHDIATCPALPGISLLARVHVQAATPELGHAALRIQTTGAAPAERNLDVTSLPLETRSSAIAAAAEEFLQALLEQPPAPAASSAPVADAPPAPAPRGSEPPAPARRWELGIAGSAARFRDFTDAFGGDLRLRVWALPWLSLTARVGLSESSYSLPGGSAPSAPAAIRPDELRSSAWHLGVDAGFVLFARPPWTISSGAGASLDRASYTLEYLPDADALLGFASGNDNHAWDFVGNAGFELRWASGAWAISYGLVGFIPILSSYSDAIELEDGSSAPRSGLGEHWGVEVNLGVWFAFDGA